MARDWQAPTELPDLRRAGIIALDTETRDDGIRADRGSAWPWRGGYICGISVAWRDDRGIRAHYFPLCHPDSENFPRENVARWLADLLASGVRIVTQNGLYDYGWLWAAFDLRMPSSEQLEEIGALATLIDENRFDYGLEHCALGEDCLVKTRRCWKRRSRPPAGHRVSASSTSPSTFTSCPRTSSAPTPRPTPWPPWRYLRI